MLNTPYFWDIWFSTLSGGGGSTWFSNPAEPPLAADGFVQPLKAHQEFLWDGWIFAVSVGFWFSMWSQKNISDFIHLYDIVSYWVIHLRCKIWFQFCWLNEGWLIRAKSDRMSLDPLVSPSTMIHSFTACLTIYDSNTAIIGWSRIPNNMISRCSLSFLPLTNGFHIYRGFWSHWGTPKSSSH